MLLTDRTPDRADEFAELAAVLGDTVTWLRRQTRPSEWSAVALSTLDTLDRRGSHRVSDLVALEHISQPGMTGLIGRLATAGLVERAGDPRDRRASLVRITEGGHRHLAEVRRSRASMLSTQLSGLPEQHQQALLDALPALTALTADRVDPPRT